MAQARFNKKLIWDSPTVASQPKPKFTDTFGEEITKLQAVKEKVEIISDMYISTLKNECYDEKSLPGGRALLKQIFWGLLTNEKYDCSEKLDDACHNVIMERESVGEFAKRVSEGVDWKRLEEEEKKRKEARKAKRAEKAKKV